MLISLESVINHHQTVDNKYDTNFERRKNRFIGFQVLKNRFSFFSVFFYTDVGSVVGFFKTAVSVRFSVNRPNTTSDPPVIRLCVCP